MASQQKLHQMKNSKGRKTQEKQSVKTIEYSLFVSKTEVTISTDFFIAHQVCSECAQSDSQDVDHG